MSGETIKEFLVGLGFEVDQGSLNKFNSGLKKATIVVTALGAAATAAAGLITKFVTGVAQDFDAISDLGGRVNATAHEIMELGYVATLTDSSVEAVASSLDGLNRTMGEASMGMGRGKVVFEQLGISLKDANGNMKTTAAMMAEIGDTIKDLSRQEQVAILSKLGIDPTMIGALTGDVAQLRAEFNQIYSDLEIDANAAAQASSDFMDSVGRLSFVFDALRKAVALKFMGQIQGGIDRMRKLLVENMPKIVNAITPIINMILRIAEAFIAVVARIAQFAGVLIGWFNRINDATGGWAGYILAAAAAWKYLNLAFLASPIGLLLSLAAIVLLLIDDFLTFKEGGDSLIDWGSNFGILMQVVTSILTGLLAGFLAVKGAILAKAAVLAIAKGAMAAYTAVVTGVKVALGFAKGAMALFNAVMLANPIGLVIAAVAGLIAIGYLLISNWDTVKDWFIGLWDWFSEKFPNISGFITATFEKASALVLAIFQAVKDWFSTLIGWYAEAFGAIVGFVSEPFQAAASAVLNIFQGVKDWFAGFLDWIMAGFDKIKGVADAVTGFAGKATDAVSQGASNAWGSVKGWFGGGENNAAPPSAPSPQAAATLGGMNQTVSQNTEIIVQGASDPQATARAVSGQQNRVNADLTRNLAGAAR